MEVSKKVRCKVCGRSSVGGKGAQRVEVGGRWARKGVKRVEESAVLDGKGVKSVEEVVAEVGKKKGCKG